MEKKINIPLTVVAIICVISLVVMTVALWSSSTDKGAAVFTPPSFEVNAVSGTPIPPENLGWGELDVQAYKVSICSVVTIKNGKADIWFTNPESNTVWLKLRILDQDGKVLGETGLICSGEYVQSIVFEKIPKDGATVSFKLMAYEPETYYSAGSATLNMVVRVKEN